MDCVTICWHALYGHGTTISHCLLHLLWTLSCGIIHSQSGILCQLMSLEFLSFHRSQKGWLVEIMVMVPWLNLHWSTRLWDCSQSQGTSQAMEKLVNPVQFALNAKFLVVARRIPGLSDKRYIETIYVIWECSDLLCNHVRYCTLAFGSEMWGHLKSVPMQFNIYLQNLLIHAYKFGVTSFSLY